MTFESVARPNDISIEMHFLEHFRQIDGSKNKIRVQCQNKIFISPEISVGIFSGLPIYKYAHISDEHIKYGEKILFCFWWEKNFSSNFIKLNWA